MMSCRGRVKLWVGERQANEGHTHTHTHTHTHETEWQGGTQPCTQAICLAIHHDHHRHLWGSSPNLSLTCSPSTPQDIQDTPLGPRGGDGPQDEDLGCSQVTLCLFPSPFRAPLLRLEKQPRSRPERPLTTLSSGTDRLNVHSWLFTKASVKQEGEPSETPPLNRGAGSVCPQGATFQTGRARQTVRCPAWDHVP